jgi:hypothetical protein
VARTGPAALRYSIRSSSQQSLDALARLWTPWPSQIDRYVGRGRALREKGSSTFTGHRGIVGEPAALFAGATRLRHGSSFLPLPAQCSELA